MSKPREENPELARVLSRVNALMKHDLEKTVPMPSPPLERPVEPVEPVETEASVEAEVPVLTEVYEGELPDFAPRSLDNLAVADGMEDKPQPDDQALEEIVAELMPLIRAEVKKAVRQELVNTEKIVNYRLETEFVQTLLEKLRAERDA